METYRSQLTNEEVEGLLDSLRHLVEHEGSSAMRNHLDIEWARDNIVEYSRHGQVVKFYQGDKFLGIMTFDIGLSWWTSKPMLQEVVILSMPNTHGLQRMALKELEKIARENNIELIVGGCIFQANPQVITNGYKKFGYKESYPTYLKVTNNEN